MKVIRWKGSGSIPEVSIGEHDGIDGHDKEHQGPF